jgi:hypothetical protein
MSYLVEKVDVVNDIETTTPGKVLDARAGNTLRVLINSVADGVLWQEEILSLVSTPPVSPTDGDRHIVGQSATGDWLGHDGEIATWDATGSAWTFETPQERWGVFNHNTTQLLFYHVGAWLVLGDLGQITTILNEAEAARDEILNDPGFQAVSADLLGDDEIGTVAAALAIITAVNNNSANINTVAGISVAVTTVAGKETEITALGARTTEIDALYAELDQIAVKENAANKKTTLSEDSDTYFPTQQAVNEGLDQTMAEIMGYAPRDLMDVFGTATVAATFEALRASILGGDFSHLRLGDYIDLDSFTVNNWYNGAAYDSATGAWDTTVTVTKNLSYENTRVEIVGFDDYRYVGNAAYPSAHHVTMMFKQVPLKAPMHKLNVSPYYQTSQGYTGSDLVVYGLAEWYTAIASQFGTATPYQVDRYIATTSTSEWCGAERLFLPTGMNIFGSPGFALSDRGVGTQHHFPLYALNPNKRRKGYNGAVRDAWWLAEPSAGSSSAFAGVHYYGILYSLNSYDSHGVAPAFLI